MGNSGGYGAMDRPGDVANIRRMAEQLKAITYRKPLIDRVKNRVSRRSSKVFLRADFADLGGYDQVGRALRRLVRDGVLLSIGYGLYAKARRSSLSGTTIPDGDAIQLALEALDRLGVKATVANIVRANAERKTTQLLGVPMVNVGAQRITRTIQFLGRPVLYERTPYERSGWPDEQDLSDLLL